MKTAVAQTHMTDKEWRGRDAEAVSQVYSRYSELVIVEAEGTHLHTADGRDVLDFGCGIAVTSVGHRHPRVVQAVHEQVDKLWHTSTTAYHTKIVETAERLVAITPDGLDRVFFGNSGAEAVEAALKVARRSTGRTDIIAFEGSFHGRTYGALSLTASKSKYHRGVGPFLPGVHHTPYPYCFRTCSHAPGEPCPIAAGKYLDDMFDLWVDPESVAAIVVEPILGEGGYVVPPEGFLQTLRSYCDRYGMLLVADEVQSGMGRTGKMFAVDHDAVKPDIMCVAKALGDGLPISAMVARHEVMEAWHAGEHGTTYGGNPVACAAALAVMDVIEDEHLLDRSARLGTQIMERLATWKDRYAHVADIRGRGLMIGVEFMEGATPATAFVEGVRSDAIERGVLTLACGRDENVIRLVPPMTISDADLDAGLSMLEASIEAMERKS